MSQFNMMFHKYLAVGIEDKREIHRGRLIMTRTHLEERDKIILMVTLGGDVSYGKVQHTLLNVFTGEEEKGKEECVNVVHCYSCNKMGNISRVCPDNKYKGAGSTIKQNDLQCGKIGHPSFACKKEEK